MIIIFSHWKLRLWLIIYYKTNLKLTLSKYCAVVNLLEIPDEKLEQNLVLLTKVLFDGKLSKKEKIGSILYGNAVIWYAILYLLPTLDRWYSSKTVIFFL